MDNLQVKNVSKDGIVLDSEKDIIVSVEYLESLILLIDDVLSFTDEEFEEYKEMLINQKNTKDIVKILSMLEKCRNNHLKDKDGVING